MKPAETPSKYMPRNTYEYAVYLQMLRKQKIKVAQACVALKRGEITLAECRRENIKLDSMREYLKYNYGDDQPSQRSM